MGRLAEAPAAGASGSPETHGPLVPLLLALTAVTGVVDAFSYLVLGHVFVANMTGNVVFVAFALAGAKGFSLASSLLALGAFLIGAFVGGRLARPLAMHRGRLVTGAASIEVALTAGALVVNFVLGHRGGGAGQFLLIGLLGSAMGVQNAAARKLAVPDLTTTVLTLTITGMAADRLVGTGAAVRASRRVSAVVVMFTGALVAAILVLRAGAQIALALALFLLAVVAGVAAVLSRGEPAWVRAH